LLAKRLSARYSPDIDIKHRGCLVRATHALLSTLLNATRRCPTFAGFREIRMAQLAPPQPPTHFPPVVALADDDGLQRLRFRLWQLSLTALTLVITAWFCSFGWAPAILALLVAKHVLVAILVMGLGVDARQSTNA
jgi:hypothetical protein